MELTDLVEVFAADGEEEPRRTHARAGAIRACSTITLSSHCSIRELASPRWR